MSIRPTERAGLTLVEALIMVVVIAILALTVVPRLMGAGRQAREACLRADLNALRSAVQLFRADVGGHPDKLGHLMRDKPPKNCRVPPDGHKIKCLEANFRGPYLTTPDGELPVDAVTGESDWQYSQRTGHVSSAATGTGLDGTPYASW